MMLKIQDLTKTFGVQSGWLRGTKRTIKAVDHVSLTLPEGKSLGIVGESGSGKTTLSKILAGLFEPNSGSATFGEVDLLTLSRLERSKMVQMVFQDPFASLNPKLLLGTQLLESIQQNRTAQDSFTEAESLMTDVGLSPDYLKRYPHQLSGGQRQRFALARALSAHPQLLLADEPVSSLDLSVQAQIINLFNDLKEKRKFTLVVISHDLAVIANMCDHVIVMRQGEVVEQGSVLGLLSSPHHPYTKRLLEAAPQL